MEKRMMEVGVRTTEEGHIEIYQGGIGGESDSVYITADQVDVLVQWLQQAKAEAAGRKEPKN